jgi:uncharacterized protein (DUF58 family)
VGLVLVGHDVEHFVPPARGRTHLLRLLRDVLGIPPAAGTTRLSEAATFILRTTRRRSLVFWISDFEDMLDGRNLRVLGRRHELTAVALRDPRDEALPAVGWLELEDLETGARRLVNTSSRRVREQYQREARARRARAEQALAEAHCPVIEVRTDRSYLPVLIRYFSARGRKGAR